MPSFTFFDQKNFPAKNCGRLVETIPIFVGRFRLGFEKMDLVFI